jgi:hypothetical protein
MERAVASLCDMPKRCPVVRQFSKGAVEVRQLLYGGYSHIYKIYFTIDSDGLDPAHPSRRAARTKAKRTFRIGSVNPAASGRV